MEEKYGDTEEGTGETRGVGRENGEKFLRLLKSTTSCLGSRVINSFCKKYLHSFSGDVISGDSHTVRLRHIMAISTPLTLYELSGQRNR